MGSGPIFSNDTEACVPAPERNGLSPRVGTGVAGRISPEPIPAVFRKGSKNLFRPSTLKIRRLVERRPNILYQLECKTNRAMTQTNKTKGGRGPSIITLLMALFAFLTGVLSIAYALQSYQLAKDERILSTIPLRDDQRKQTVFQMDGPMYQVRFLDQGTILYVSGNSLFRMSLDEEDEDISFFGHSGSIQDYDISPDGRRVVTSSEDGTLCLWDVASGDCLAVSEQIDTLGQPDWTMLHDVVFLPGGRKLMSADMEGIKTWRTRDLRLLSAEDSDWFYLCNGLLSPNGKTVCAPVPILPEGFDVYDRAKGSVLYHLDNMSPVTYDAEGRRLLAASWEDGDMEIRDIDVRKAHRRTSRLWLNAPRGRISAIHLSRSGKVLVSAHEDGTVRIWNAENGAEREVLHWEGRVINSICIDPTDTRILACSNGSGEYCIWGPFSY